MTTTTSAIKKGIKAPLLLLAAIISSPGIAPGYEIHSPDNNSFYNFKGFGTLGGVVSDSDKLGFKRHILQEDVVTRDSPQLLTDSRVGLQMNVRYKEKLQGTVQLLANQKTKELNDFIHLAYLQMNVNPQLLIRSGRLPLDVCLISENRNVGYSYLWSRPVPEFYGQFFLSFFNGFDAAYKLRTSVGIFELRGATGIFDTTVPYDNGKDLDIEFRSFWNTSIRYERSPWQVCLFYMNGTVDKTSDSFGNFTSQFKGIPPEVLFPLQPYLEEFYLVENSTVEQIACSIKYSSKGWILQSEIGRLQFEKAMGLALDSAYFSAGYRLGAFIPYGVIAWLKSSTDNLPQLAPAGTSPTMLQYAINTLHKSLDSLEARQTTFSLGIRWDIYDNMAIKAQWNHHWIPEGGAYLWGNNFTSIDDMEVNTFSLSLDFIF